MWSLPLSSLLSEHHVPQGLHLAPPGNTIPEASSFSPSSGVLTHIDCTAIAGLSCLTFQTYLLCPVGLCQYSFENSDVMLLSFIF